MLDFLMKLKLYRKAGGIVIRLDKECLQRFHRCESALDVENFDWSNFDYVIENNDSHIDKSVKDL